MWEVKHFVGGTTKGALEFLDNEIKGWFRDSGVTQVVQVTETFGHAQSGPSGTMENAVFVAVWYRPASAPAPQA